jgi:hypothetical protein
MRDFTASSLARAVVVTTRDIASAQEIFRRKMPDNVSVQPNQADLPGLVPQEWSPTKPEEAETMQVKAFKIRFKHWNCSLRLPQTSTVAMMRMMEGWRNRSMMETWTMGLVRQTTELKTTLLTTPPICCNGLAFLGLTFVPSVSYLRGKNT